MPTVPPLLSLLTDDDDAWMEHIACADMPTEVFFVQAGHVIDEEVLNTCRGCPVRTECITHAYNESLTTSSGYFGGLSPGQRKAMSLAEALEFARNDPPEDQPATADEEEPILYT